MRSDFVREDISDFFCGVSDEELAKRASEGQSDAFSELLNRYTGLIIYKILCKKPVGEDTDDYMQECSLALLDAVKGYCVGGAASFKTYASVCIQNRLISLKRSQEREKNKPMADYVEISDYLSQSSASEQTARDSDPEEQLLLSESIKELRKSLSEKLSGFEFKVFSLFYEGCSYDEIAKALGVPKKKVDNALQRIRHKLKDFLH